MIESEVMLDGPPAVPPGRSCMVAALQWESSKMWEKKVEVAKAVPIDEVTARYLVKVSGYGPLSLEGRYSKRDVNESETALGGETAAAQGLPPLPWSEVVSKPSAMLSAKEQLLTYKTYSGYHMDPTRGHYLSQIRKPLMGPARPVGDQEAYYCPDVRTITIQDGFHPLWANTPEGEPLDVIEVEVRHGGLSPLNISCVVLGGPLGVEYFSAVTMNRRWFCTKQRYACIVHALSIDDSTGGYSTISVHLSELPVEVKSLFFVSMGSLHKIDSLACLVSSRDACFSPKHTQEYLLDLSAVASSDAVGCVLAKITRASTGWSFGGLGIEDSSAGDIDALLPYMHGNAGIIQQCPDTLCTRIVAGITPEQLLPSFTSGYQPGPKLSQVICDSFNKYDKNRSGKLSLQEFTRLAEELYWGVGGNPPPSEVIQRTSETAFRSLDTSHDGKLSLKEFAVMFETSPLGRSLAEQKIFTLQ